MHETLASVPVKRSGRGRFLPVNAGFSGTCILSACFLGMLVPPALVNEWTPPSPFVWFNDGKSHEGKNFAKPAFPEEHILYDYFLELAPEVWIQNNTQFTLHGSYENSRGAWLFKGIKSGRLVFGDGVSFLDGGPISISIGGEGASLFSNQGWASFSSLTVGKEGTVANRNSLLFKNRVDLNGGTIENEGALFALGELDGERHSLIQKEGTLVGHVDNLLVNKDDPKNVALNPMIDYRGGSGSSRIPGWTCSRRWPDSTSLWRDSFFTETIPH